jgi:hypothetical protein
VVKSICLLIVTSTLICSASGYTPSSQDELAREVVHQWLLFVDSGNYKDAALMMSAQVRGTQDWASYLATHRGSLGRVNKREIVEVKHASSVPRGADVRDYAIVRFKTSFERRSNAAEEITLAKMGCCWEVRDYQISGL